MLLLRLLNMYVPAARRTTDAERSPPGIHIDAAAAHHLAISGAARARRYRRLLCRLPACSRAAAREERLDLQFPLCRGLAASSSRSTNEETIISLQRRRAVGGSAFHIRLYHEPSAAALFLFAALSPLFSMSHILYILFARAISRGALFARRRRFCRLFAACRTPHKRF